MKKHERTLRGEKPYVCSFCAKTHTGEKPFACSFFDKTFAQNSKMKIRKRNHTGEKPYSCL